MKRILFACLAVSIVAPVVGWAAPIFLSELIDGPLSFQSGSKVFSNFTYLPTGEMPPATEISVESIPDGIRFFGDFHDNFGGSTSDSLITFDVDFGGDLIEHAFLNADLSVDGEFGFASITETFLPAEPALSMAIFDFGNGDALHRDSIDFDPPLAGLNVQKDVVLSSNSPDTKVRLTFFDQTFTVPEPSFGLIFAIGAFAIVLAIREVQEKKSVRCPEEKE